jgi:DNA (cytosine-5)-methyltransferase 1
VEATPGHRPRLTAAEFFAGTGLVRRALGKAGVHVVWANDVDPTKATVYASNFHSGEFLLGDVAEVEGRLIPSVDIATASFPCTDLSLAGNRAGLDGHESGTFWQFVRILREMGSRKPPVALLENVAGLGSSQDGRDLREVVESMNGLGYSCDLLLLDARYWVPQSRPRVFIVGALHPPTRFGSWMSAPELRPRWMERFRITHPSLSLHFVPLELPGSDSESLRDVIQPITDDDSRWWGPERIERFVGSLSSVQSARLSMLQQAMDRLYRTAYRRTRSGRAVWEIRADELSGCLRTARGGSSRQALVEAGKGTLRIRWMIAQEYARLMGAEDHDFSAVTETQALFGLGDGVCIPVVTWLTNRYLAPLVLGELEHPDAATA